ncbi:protein OSCP1a isoform X5 [Synchiropus splendidus]|uniref:protein OSCP1a isoform X5 n=1 Tax=Synchiropus splendidus TaxID=270530 RepID=UPI00237DA877|nr:protein OSCP1a isoform X5 [Synchiropus splendidus]
MSLRTVPLVVVNLGGEMLYILDQRLQAHCSPEDTSDKGAGLWSENDRKRVMNDIIGTMFSKSFMDQLFGPQQPYSHRTLRTVLTRLAHASILRLNPVSMERLYELVIMAFKYQVFLCPRPKDLILITYNHIDSIKQVVKDTPAVFNQVQQTHRRFIEEYSSLTEGEFQLLRQTILTFLQDSHVRVSLFLKNKAQNPNGRFAMSTGGHVPHKIDVPGLIRTFDRSGRERRSEFPTGGSYSRALKEGSLELHGDRVTKLGLNMYGATAGVDELSVMVSGFSKVHRESCRRDETSDIPNLLAKEELNLLARLMGSLKDQPGATDPGYQIDLFASLQEEDELGRSDPADGSKVVTIQATQDEHSASELAHIAGQFAEEEQPSALSHNKGDDLLAMMDDL